MSRACFLTGALGCIGAWVVKHLLDAGEEPVIFDLGDDMRRIRDLVEAEQLDRIRLIQGDVTDTAAVIAAVKSSGADRIIHLAGLQVPFCKADPVLGARVNVVGTLNLFQAAAECDISKVVYASSAAVYGPDDLGPNGSSPDESTPCNPTTHYGVYKQANEGNARVFFTDSGISSVGIRPLTVYGVGRDQGMTSDPSRAMKAAVLGRPFQIRFSGSTDYQHVSDCAATFLASADRAPEGAHVFNLHGDSVDMTEIVSLIRENAPDGAPGVSIDGPTLPIPPGLDGDQINQVIPNLPKTTLADGVSMTMKHFAMLRDEGRLDTRDLDE